MNKPLGFLLRHILFFLVLFFFGRALFLILNFSSVQHEPLSEIFKTFVYAIYLDFSAIAYFLIILLIPYLLFIFTAHSRYLKWVKIISACLITIHFLVIISEIMLYKEWRTKLSFRALSFLGNISEVAHVVSVWQILIGFTSIALLSFTFIWIQNKWFLKTNKVIDKHKAHWRVAGSIAVMALIPIAIRGGLQPIPIIQSDIYFSTNNTLNLAAVNAVWNIGQSIWENRYTGNNNPYQYFSEEEKNKLFAFLQKPEKDTTEQILKSRRPNIVLVILESWSAHTVGALGGKDSVAKNMSRLARNGIGFSNCYSSGSLSHEGNVAILSSFPAQPSTVITMQPQKYHGLNTITKSLKDVGYETTYMYCGDLSYGNIKSYIYYNQFDHIYDKNYFFGKPWKEGRMGYQDEHLFEAMHNELNKLKPPFFLSAFTLSTHSPFDFDGEKRIKDRGEYSDYLSSIYYADSVIGKFINDCKQETWFDNTLFVFLSDHSHPTPTSFQHKWPSDRKAVAVMYGNVIRDEWRGKDIHKVISQHDFAPSLCGQIGLPNPFKYGQNIFNPYTKHFAYYSFDVGYGIVTDSASVVYDIRNKFEMVNTFKRKIAGKSVDSLAKAYLQNIYTDFLSF
jgi:phosphoglycerol transferase MdoB-like AlkP superfamily enzyme